MVNIKELLTKQQWLEAFPVIKQLRTHLDETRYVELIQQAVENEGYKLFALFEKDTIVAAVGFMPMITLYNGKFIWVCDLVTDTEHRSKGYGQQLLSYVENWSRDNSYNIVSLSSGLQRLDAHRFYEEKLEYDKVSYVFLKKM